MTKKNNEIKEHRYLKTEFRVSKDGRYAEGYTAVFNELSNKLGTFRERIRPGAFAKTIKEADIRALFNHNPDYVLGRNKSGTLELSEDSRGLFSRISLPDTSYAKDLKVSIERGDINQMSFGFRAIKEDWFLDDAEGVIRELQEVKLYDISIVTYAAYPQTEVAIRTDFPEMEEKRDGLLVAFKRMELGKKLREEELKLLKEYVSNLEKRLSPKKEPKEHSEEKRSEPFDIHSALLRLNLEVEELKIDKEVINE